jgi:uncharacterized protein YgiM (DUF1202 family)
MAYCIHCNREGAKIWRTVQTGYSSYNNNKFYGKRLVCENCSQQMDSAIRQKRKRIRIFIIIIFLFILINGLARYFDKKTNNDIYTYNKEWIVLTKSGLNLRQGPTTKSRIIKSIPYNSKVEIEIRNQNKREWIKVKYKELDGYVLKKYLKEK